MKRLFVGAVGVLVMAFLVGVSAQDAAKFTNKEVMQKAQKGGLWKKVASGKASDDDKKLLVEMYTALQANGPKKGDADSWKKRTEAMVAAAKSADGKALTATAGDCMGCHKAHK
jgi:hypothetical protein